MSVKKYAVIGDPVAHSLSPQIYNPLFQKYGVDAEFVRLTVKKGALDRAALLGYAGFACTMPQKEDIIPLLDGISDEARAMHSVNIVKNENGRLLGFSTDGDGLFDAIAAAGGACRECVAIIGSGGAARSAAYAARARGMRVLVCARNAAARRKLCEDMGAQALSLAELHRAARECDALINATPQGMTGHEEFADASFVDNMKRDALVADMVYFPRETALLRRARERGLLTVPGEEMLVRQALRAFFIWTGVEARRDEAPPLLFA